MKQNIAHLHIMVPYSLVLGYAAVCGDYSLPFFSLGSHLLFFRAVLYLHKTLYITIYDLRRLILYRST